MCEEEEEEEEEDDGGLSEEERIGCGDGSEERDGIDDDVSDCLTPFE